MAFSSTKGPAFQAVGNTRSMTATTLSRAVAPFYSKHVSLIQQYDYPLLLHPSLVNIGYIPVPAETPARGGSLIFRYTHAIYPPEYAQ